MFFLNQIETGLCIKAQLTINSCQLTFLDDVLGNALSQRLVLNDAIDGVISPDSHVQSHKTTFAHQQHICGVDSTG